MTENTNHTTPTPEQMGDQLDEELKDTVAEWEENPQEGETLDERIDERLRRMVAGWVGADADADWKTIGSKADANTRAAVAKWVDANEDADWSTISRRMENRIRLGVARLVKAKGETPDAEAAEDEASWSDIGAKIETDVRGWVGSLVGTGKDADWKTIGDEIMGHVKTAFDKVSESLKGEEEEQQQGYQQSEKIDIEGDESDPSGSGPKVTSEKPVEPKE